MKTLWHAPGCSPRSAEEEMEREGEVKRDKADPLTTQRCGPWGSEGGRWLRGHAGGSAPSCGTPVRAARAEPAEETRGSSAPPGNTPDSARARARARAAPRRRRAAARPGAWLDPTLHYTTEHTRTGTGILPLTLSR